MRSRSLLDLGLFRRADRECRFSLTRVKNHPQKGQYTFDSRDASYAVGEGGSFVVKFLDVTNSGSTERTFKFATPVDA